MVRHGVRRDERVDDPLRADPCIVAVVDFRQHHDELIAAVPADRVRVPDTLDQSCRHRLQQLVANHVSQAVVHILEPIEIHEQHGQVVAVATRHGDRLCEPVVQQGAVG